MQSAGILITGNIAMCTIHRENIKVLFFCFLSLYSNFTSTSMVQVETKGFWTQRGKKKLPWIESNKTNQ